MQFISVNFQQHYSSFQCHMIRNEYADLMIKNFLFLLLSTVELLNIFVETTTLMHKELIYFQVEIFDNILNVFAVSFDFTEPKLLNLSYN